MVYVYKDLISSVCVSGWRTSLSLEMVALICSEPGVTVKALLQYMKRFKLLYVVLVLVTDLVLMPCCRACWATLAARVISS